MPSAKQQNCLRILQSLIEETQRGSLPLVWLRPRPLDERDAFEDDFDFLADSRQFHKILGYVFNACTEQGVSFVVRQRSPFKRQIDLLGNNGKQLTLEFWPHAEFRVSNHHGHLSRAAITYATYARLPAAGQSALRAALYILHLHHKQKPLNEGATPHRLKFFLAQIQTPAVLRQALTQLQSGHPDLNQARVLALDYLRDRAIPIEPPLRIAWTRQWLKLRHALHWPVPGVIAVVGPDGGGKSTLVDAIRNSKAGPAFRFQSFKRFFRRPLFHLFTSEPRNVRDEKVLWLILPIAWIFLSLSRWLTGWRHPVILDRYFYDYFVRNVRDPEVPLRRIRGYSLCSHLVPMPRQIIVASCPTPIIRARKQEMTEDSMHDLYEVYLDQVVRCGLPEVLFCHTGITPDASCDQATDFILGREPSRLEEEAPYCLP